MSEQPSRQTVALGNVYDDTVFQFRHSVREGKEREAFGELRSFPVQVQVAYTRPDGMRGVRVVTQSIEVAESMDEVAVNAEVVQDFSIQQTAQEARRGNTHLAQQNMRRLRRAQQEARAEDQAAYDAVTAQMEAGLAAGEQRSDTAAMALQNATGWNAVKARKKR